MTLLFSCSQSNEDVMVATKYWQAQKNKDMSALAATLADPKEIEMFKHMKFSANKFIVSKVNDEVLVKLERFCYPDLVINMAIVDIKGIKKVDSKLTTRNFFESAMKNNKPLKKYCYDFDDKRLSGKINGQMWDYKKVATRVVDWGTKKTISVSVYAEDCNTESYGYCKLPKLIISNLDLSSDGGNFTNSENITIHTPPSDNEIISKGSYRISHPNPDITKIEISFEKGTQNFLNGFVELETKTLTIN